MERVRDEGDGRLVLTNLTKTENGEYKCIAKNRKDEVSSATSVKVLGKYYSCE